MNRVLTTFVVLSLLTSFALAEGISVEGIAERMVEPNLASVELGVETQGDTAKIATSRNAEVMSQVHASLLSAGIKKEDLKTSSFNLSPQYHYPKGEPAVLTGYLASNILRITVRGEDLKRIGEIIDLASDAGANKVRNILFTVENSQELEMELLAEAVKNGKLKAQVMAEAADVRLGKLLDLSSYSSSIMPYRMALQDESYALMAKANTPIEPGEIKLSARVSIRYDVGN